MLMQFASDSAKKKDSEKCKRINSDEILVFAKVIECYIEFHPEHSPMFSGVLRSHMTSFHAFRPNSPFQNINTLQSM